MIKVVRGALTQNFCKYLATNMEMLMHLAEYPEDKWTKNSTGYYAPIFLESLLLHLQPLIEKQVSKKLYPTYSYGRIYHQNSSLNKHVDRESGEYGVTCCIQKDIDWPIHFETESGKIISQELNVGDICVYKGIDYPHWRNEYHGKKQIQVFLMYVDSNGKYSDWKWDKRMGLCHECIISPVEK
jgi:hypothetical protein